MVYGNYLHVIITGCPHHDKRKHSRHLKILRSFLPQDDTAITSSFHSNDIWDWSSGYFIINLAKRNLNLTERSGVQSYWGHSWPENDVPSSAGVSPYHNIDKGCPFFIPRRKYLSVLQY